MPPGALKMTVDPPEPPSGYNVSQTVRMTCEGSAGSQPDQVDIEWQWTVLDSRGEQPFTPYVPTFDVNISTWELLLFFFSLERNTTGKFILPCHYADN
jgi:hypothetical protein